jgi:hypothetical protein
MVSFLSALPVAGRLNYLFGHKQMRLITIFLLTLFVAAYAQGQSHYNRDFAVGADKYVVVSSTTTEVVLELRKRPGKDLLQNVVIWSPHMVPEYEVQDLVFDQSPEIIVRWAAGGTGISETRLQIFGIVAEQIVSFGSFVISRDLVDDFIPPGGKKTYRERLYGVVTFPEKNSLLYRYTQNVKEHGKTSTTTAVQRFTFDAKTMKYVVTKEPEQPHAADTE